MKLLIQLAALFAFGFQASFTTAQNNLADSAILETLAWSPDGTRIAGSYSDSTIAIWSVDDLSTPLLRFQVELADEISWTPDSRHLIIYGTTIEVDGVLQKSVTKWEASNGEMVDTLMSFQLDKGLRLVRGGYYVSPVLALDSTATKSALSFASGEIFLSAEDIIRLQNEAPTNFVSRMMWSRDNQHLAAVYGTSDTYTTDIQC